MNLQQKINALPNGKVLNVSNMRDDGGGVSISIVTSRGKTRNIQIENLPIISNNYNSYKAAIDMLGADYQYLAEYFKIVQELQKGDLVYIKYVMQNNFPAFISNNTTYKFATKLLGPNYNYIDNYYDLAIAIRDDDYEMVDDIIKSTIDPRDHDDFAYHIAQQYGNQKYINLIRDEIVERDWLEQQVLEKLLGDHGPHKELHQYMRKL